MVRLGKQLVSGERGQALAIVLGLLALGGLTIAVSLNYATTSLNGSRIFQEKMKGVYAAGAGVEDALWCLGYSISPPTQLPEDINQMAVAIATENQGISTMYFGQLVEPREQYWKLTVSGTISWVEDNRYEYEITVTCTVDQTMHLNQIGARLPVGYHYEDDSTYRSDVGAVPDYDPDIIQDDQGADLLNWPWKEWMPDPPRPVLDTEGDVYSQTFYITGTGSLGGKYAWVEGDLAAVGAVGEITGTRYKISANAACPGDGKITAKIVADIMIVGGEIHILSWLISK